MRMCADRGSCIDRSQCMRILQRMRPGAAVYAAWNAYFGYQQDAPVPFMPSLGFQIDGLVFKLMIKDCACCQQHIMIPLQCHGRNKLSIALDGGHDSLNKLVNQPQSSQLAIALFVCTTRREPPLDHTQLSIYVDFMHGQQEYRYCMLQRLHA